MYINIKYIFILLISFYIQNINAGEVDLQIEVDIADTHNLVFGQIISFSITITNFGPDDAGAKSIAFNPNRIFIGDISEINGNPVIVIVQDTSIEQECFLVSIISAPPPIPGAQVSITYLFSFPILPANQSITCYGKAQILLKKGQKLLEFTAIVNQDDVESNLENNLIGVIFGIRPRIIPVNNIYSLVILTLIILLMGQLYLKRARLQNTHS